MTMKNRRIIRKSTVAERSKSFLGKSKKRTASGGFSRPIRDNEAMSRDLKRSPSAARSSAFGGELKLSGFAPEHRQEILESLRHLASVEEDRDASNRVLKLVDGRDGIVVHTAQAHLAVALGKHIHRSRKGGCLEIEWPKGDEVARVIWIAG